MKDLKAKPVERVAEFKALLDAFCEMARRESADLLPYEGAGPTYFTSLSEAQQVQVLNNFRFYFEVCSETLAQGATLRDDKVFVWRMFQKMKVHPPSELMSSIQEGEVIEIYNADFIQVFRNLCFFEICSYSLDELLCRPFWELIHRDEKITGLIVEQASKLLTGFNGVFQFEVPEHVITEIASRAKNRVTVQQRLGATLWNPQGSPIALIALLKVKEITSGGLPVRLTHSASPQ